MIDDVAYYVEGIKRGDYGVLARAISMVENSTSLSTQILEQVAPSHSVPVIGFTGPPGSGKSTLVGATVENYLKKGKRVAVLAIDPSSPFNKGSLLGDRIRMISLFNDPNIYIRSLSNRGALGGLSYRTIEIVDILKSSAFDVVLLETVGVGQSEIDVVGLADKTIVVLVPESGDEIQHSKSGIMEIADLFVVNKTDREGADCFVSSLKKVLHQNHQNTNVIKTSAKERIGTQELFEWIEKPIIKDKSRELALLTERAWRLIVHKQVRSVDKEKLITHLQDCYERADFNLYRFISEMY